MAEWRFKERVRSDITEDPIGENFFTTNDLEGGLADALVRESIQNSLDARCRDNNAVVKVRFYFSGQSNAREIKIKDHRFFKGIYEHIVYSNDNGILKNNIPNPLEKAQYLVIEDSNTFGLDGDIKESDDPKTESPEGHNFFWFWRAVGKSGKRYNELGKWGLGKTVFPLSSKINTFFGLTNRWNDKKDYLMGLSVLKTHHLNREERVRRYPYGYFGLYDTDEKDKNFAIPTDDEGLLNDFKNTFNLKRNELGSGLSIVIPFPRTDEINSDSVIKSVLQQYFYPIIKGGLLVEIIDDDNQINIEINKETIFSRFNEWDLTDEYKKLFNLCSWSIQQPFEEFIKLKRPSEENVTQWRDDELIDEKVQKLIDAKIDPFDKGSPVAFNVPVRIKKTDGQAQICRFRVIIEKDEELKESDSHFVRGSITITGIKKPKNKSARAIVIIDDKDLATLLGLAENPAHTQFQKDSPHFRGKYEKGEKVITFIETSIDKLCSWLVIQAKGVDREMMKDIFYIDLSDNEDEPEPGPRPGTEPEPEPPPIPPPGKKSPFIIIKKSDGFCIKRNTEFDQAKKIDIKIAVAYMAVKGGPLRQYSKYDFELDKEPISVISSEIYNLDYKQNKISFSVNTDNDYSIDIIGFDNKRDLYIKADHYDSEV